MGCTSSKQARRDRRRSPSPLYRCHSLPERQHVVALRSSTLGSLKLDPAAATTDEEMMKSANDLRDFPSEVTDAKAWSEMIERKIPKTPTMTPPNEPETINAWELMKGLEDAAPPPRHRHGDIADRSFSFHVSGEGDLQQELTPKPKISGDSPATKPLWMVLGDEEDSIVADFDPEVLSTFRKALEELSPQHPFLLRSPESEKTTPPAKSWDFEPRNGREIPKFAGIVKARINAFQEKIDAKRANRNANAAKVAPSDKCPPGGEGKVVFYFTSLRGVRKTYEECSSVRLILKGYGVRVDERDVSMHGGFKEELNAMLGPGFGGSQLPRVFANGKYIGGAEEVRHMHDAGELEQALEGCEMVAVGRGGNARVCERCGDARFIPCETCSGSCRLFVEEGDEEEEGEEQVTGWFRRCPVCNENGLVRCPVCC